MENYLSLTDKIQICILDKIPMSTFHLHCNRSEGFLFLTPFSLFSIPIGSEKKQPKKQQIQETLLYWSAELQIKQVSLRMELKYLLSLLFLVIWVILTTEFILTSGYF